MNYYKDKFNSSKNFKTLYKLLNRIKNISNIVNESSFNLNTSIEFLKEKKLDYKSIYESFRNMKYENMVKGKNLELKG